MRLSLLAGALSALIGATPSPAPAPSGVFIVEPYLQLGDVAYSGDQSTLDLLWHTDTVNADWVVETTTATHPGWTATSTVVGGRTIAVAGLAPHVVHQVTIGAFPQGATFEYRVKRNGTVVFQATGHARKNAAMPYRFALWGDCGVNSDGQKAVAYRAYTMHPDFVAVAGDVVYGSGRMSEYRTNYFPIYNADSASPATGAPLARSVPFVAALGNHDAGHASAKDSVRDQWGYFAYWSMPLNGPFTKQGPYTPRVAGDTTSPEKMGRALGNTWPRMANYSFDYGNAHWTVLDANNYVNWTDPWLRNWVAQDLARAKNATFKFVMFHQPGFNSSRTHFSEQQMRLMSDVFEAGGVDIVFAGHVHNYQRSYPMKFLPRIFDDPKVLEDNQLHAPNAYDHEKLPYTINRDYTFDKSFDGVRKTVPKGIIYIISGAGGADLYTPEQTGEQASWQSFTKSFIADRFSFSIVDVAGRRLTFRQISATGEELDKFVMTKPEPAGTPLARASTPVTPPSGS